MTSTGTRLAELGRRTIEPRHDQLRQVVDVLSNTRKSKSRRNGSLTNDEIIQKLSTGQLAKLWGGDTSGFRSPSEADWKLICAIVWFTRDPARIALICRQSGLNRDKYDTGDYLSRTIAAVLETVSARAGGGSELEDALESGDDELYDKKLILVNERSIEEISTAVETAVVEAEAKRAVPELYLHGSVPVRLVGANSEPIFERLTEAKLSRKVEREVYAYRFVEGHPRATRVLPPVITDIQANPEPPWPRVDGIAVTPVPMSDGQIITKRGFYKDASVIYIPTGLGDIDIPDEPTRQDIRAALWTIWFPFAQFPFQDRASKAHLLAGIILTPLLRYSIDGTVPGVIITAPDQGHGKTLLFLAGSTILLGRPGAVRPLPTRGEMAKELPEILGTGALIHCFDNADTLIDHPGLAVAISALSYSARRFGKNDETLESPNRCTFCITGNNVQVGGDMTRRFIWVLLDAKMHRAFRRDNFRIPNLIKYIQEHRTAIIRAVLILWKAWVVAGRPAPKHVPVLGGFEEWRHTIGGILEFAGVRGLLGNADQMYRQADQESADVASFLYEWYRYSDGRAVSINFLHQLCEHDPALRGLLPTNVALAWDRGPESSKKAMGKLLASVAGKIHEHGLTVTRAGHESHSKRLLWSVGLAKGYKNPTNFTPKELPAHFKDDSKEPY